MNLHDAVNKQWLAGDASDRKFFRSVNSAGQSSICMEFPEWGHGFGGDPLNWLHMQKAFHNMGLPIPHVLKTDPDQKSIWVEDLGDTFLSQAFSAAEIDLQKSNCAEIIEYYKQALSLLLLAQYPKKDFHHPGKQRFFDFEKLFYEMNFFVTHFLNRLLSFHFTPSHHANLFSDLTRLCQRLEKSDQVLCHRDYHARNIMVHKNKLYWIDFQDARMGPHTYDVVSLVRDSYVPITWETRQYLFQYYLENLNSIRSQKGLKLMNEKDYFYEILLVGMQRNVKALGSFGYLATEKSKKSFLKNILPTLAILNSIEAKKYENTDLEKEFPYLSQLLFDLFQGKLCQIVKDKIDDVQ